MLRFEFQANAVISYYFAARRSYRSPRSNRRSDPYPLDPSSGLLASLLERPDLLALLEERSDGEDGGNDREPREHSRGIPVPAWDAIALASGPGLACVGGLVVAVRGCWGRWGVVMLASRRRRSSESLPGRAW